jgi:bifunctional UDP-N-acetylglucosamine pyrophosphorylase/glucosamine-1-phosphate N-acetyltransferase
MVVSQKIFMSKISVVIAAAGEGSRASLPYPKTLLSIKGKPILVRIAELLAPYDNHPIVIVNRDGKKQIDQCLLKNNIQARLVVQSIPNGMGDAVLCIENPPAFARSEHVLLVWGDIPFIQPKTVSIMVNHHLEQDCDFTFATRIVDQAYTVVFREKSGKVTRLIETREKGITKLQAGERDIGLFIFRRSVTLEALREELPNKWGKSTGEHGFLYIIEHLVAKGLRVEALPIAKEIELVSLNKMEDVSSYL